MKNPINKVSGKNQQFLQHVCSGIIALLFWHLIRKTDESCFLALKALKSIVV